MEFLYGNKKIFLGAAIFSVFVGIGNTGAPAYLRRLW